MRIGVLAWGSLIWDRRDLAMQGLFEPTGPRLPLEFGRISGDERLTLVIDESVGTKCVTYAVQSPIEYLDYALINLWQREGSDQEKPPANIRTSGRVGYIDLKSNSRNVKATIRHPQSIEAIGSWGTENGYDAVIWTSLASNFLEKKSIALSVDTAMAHLAGLSLPVLSVALNYIRNAPPEIQTPVRTAVNERWPVPGG